MASPVPVLTDPSSAGLEHVTFDLYRDVHKGIRAELFNLTGAIGRADVQDGDEVAALVARLDRFLALLDDHAAHEDVHLSPLIGRHDGDLARRVGAEHRLVHTTMVQLRRTGEAAVDASAQSRPLAVHRLYLSSANFTSQYLAHLATEELDVMPMIARRTTVEELVDINTQLVSSISPADMQAYLSLILPAQNPAERAALEEAMAQTT